MIIHFSSITPHLKSFFINVCVLLALGSVDLLTCMSLWMSVSILGGVKCQSTDAYTTKRFLKGS